MSNTEKVSDEVMKDIADGPAGNKDYQAQKKRSLANFKKHLETVEKVNDEISQLITAPEQFESYVKNYFFGIRVKEVTKDKMTGKQKPTGNLVPPTMGYAKNLKAVLFGVFVREFKVCIISILKICFMAGICFNLNITQMNLADQMLFPNHYDWWRKYMEYLKKEGRGTVHHKPGLHNKFSEAAMTLAYHCLQVILFYNFLNNLILVFRPLLIEIILKCARDIRSSSPWSS